MEKQLSEEVKLFEEMVEFMEKISVRNLEELSIDDRKALSVARNNVNDVHRELCDVISSSPVIDVSLIVKDYTLKVGKELNDICSKVSNLTIKDDIKDYVDSFQHDDDAVIDDAVIDDAVIDDAVIDDAVIDDAVIYDAASHMAYLEKRKKLLLETEDYEQTLEFLHKLRSEKEHVSEKDLDILSHVYGFIMLVYQDLSYKMNVDLSSSVSDLDVSLMINESRSKVENKLNYICNNMTNHSIKEAISQYLVRFKAGPRPKEHLPLTYILQIVKGRKRVSCKSEMKTTNKKSKLGSGDGESWRDAAFDFGYHDNSKHIKKQADIFTQIDAIFECLGKGTEIQHASTADDISEDDFLVDWDPECLENGVDVERASSIYDSSEDDYEMSEGILSF